MPAAAVTPAPIAYIKVVAVKKLVVGFLVRAAGPRFGVRTGASRTILVEDFAGINLSALDSASFTVKKLECSKQAFA